MKNICLAVFALFAVDPASANDSSAAVGLGGIELTKNNAISMDSEDLFLSQKRVTVKYRYTNHSNKDVETLISFPLPSIPYGIDEYLGDAGYPDWNDLQFATLIDGKSAKLVRMDMITIGGKDVSARLKHLGWPVDYWNNEEFSQKLDALSGAQKTAFLAEGLLKHPKYDPKAVEPAWQVTTNITRIQRFPAGKTVTVEHSYTPVAGGSVAGALERDYRRDTDSGFARYAKHYCIDQQFLKGFDRVRYAKQPKGASDDEISQATLYGEVWLSYVLKSGANWRGPIKDFRLVVDKGTPKNLVSFCMEGVKKISPTQFEVRKTNFEPTRNLDILIVGWATPD
jgi:Domain of unknown function (DUF4424)